MFTTEIKLPDNHRKPQLSQYSESFKDDVQSDGQFTVVKMLTIRLIPTDYVTDMQIYNHHHSHTHYTLLR